MNTSILQGELLDISPERQFSLSLENLRNNGNENVIETVEDFKSTTARIALQIGEQIAEDENDKELPKSFEFFDLETKLWHLVELMYTYRFSEPEKLAKEYPFSSLRVKLENFLRLNRKLKELEIILYWIQSNSKSNFLGDSYIPASKWSNSRLRVQQKNLKALTKNSENSAELIDELDFDAPLRSGKELDELDYTNDSQVFERIYKLVLANRIQEAIDYANSSGNYAMALILIGYVQDYYDPIIDGASISLEYDAMTQDDSSMDQGSQAQESGGIKHKLLWKGSVYKLSQMPDINPFERLIYNFISGGDISDNLKHKECNWEEYLLLYVSQMYSYEIDKFINLTFSKENLKEEVLPFNIPAPQYSTIDETLNIILKSNSKVIIESEHPLRIICGGIMINKIPTLLQNIVREQKAKKESLKNNFNLLRVITHLSIVHFMMDATDLTIKSVITEVIGLYVHALEDYGLYDLIPVYLSFIPDEADARERYAQFLTTFTSHEDRIRQLQVTKKFINLKNDDLEGENDILAQERISNVLRRTVERIINETEPYYVPDSLVVVQNDEKDVTDVDRKLCHSVEWFYENSMYEDAILASIIIVRRFLLCGKLSSLRFFAENKTFLQLIKDYEFDAQVKLISMPDQSNRVNDENKEELYYYQKFVEVLNLMEDWKSFLKENQIINSTNIEMENSFWKSKHIGNSIEKIIKTIQTLLNSWLTNLVSMSNDREVFKELRTIYIPFFIMELLQICEFARFNDWKYMRECFDLIKAVADDCNNDFLQCFIMSGRLNELLQRSSEIAVISMENGIDGLFHV